MSPLESKLKRSPYLSQMTRAADMQHTAAATLICPSGTAANGDNEAVGEGGAARDFFELKCPELLQHLAEWIADHPPFRVYCLTCRPATTTSALAQETRLHQHEESNFCNLLY
eukprot:CCRYP_013302-RA/>CCRYP_013302-RA protein AED:0.08 eAED:0.16 QI:683/0.5/0.66/1/0.5/0.33/3/0/112